MRNIIWDQCHSHTCPINVTVSSYSHTKMYLNLFNEVLSIWCFSGSDAGQDGPTIDHFDFGLITPGLVHLEELHLTYGWGTFFHKLIGPLQDPITKQRQVKLDWYELLCVGSPTVQLVSQHGLFCTMWLGRSRGCWTTSNLSFSAFNKTLHSLKPWQVFCCELLATY